MVFVFLVVKATLAVLGWYCRLPAASDGRKQQAADVCVGALPPCDLLLGGGRDSCRIGGLGCCPRRRHPRHHQAAPLALQPSPPPSPSLPALPPPSSSLAYRSPRRCPRRCRHDRRFARCCRPIAASAPAQPTRSRGATELCAAHRSDQDHVHEKSLKTKENRVMSRKKSPAAHHTGDVLACAARGSIPWTRFSPQQLFLVHLLGARLLWSPASPAACARESGQCEYGSCDADGSTRRAKQVLAQLCTCRSAVGTGRSRR